jgi:hypothetical protein
LVERIFLKHAGENAGAAAVVFFVLDWVRCGIRAEEELGAA